MKLALTSLIFIFSINLYADIHVQSGEAQTIMLELFSSEGCSSCPPAEKWLNGFENNPDLWKKYIPLAFHVDYWDRLGWKDPFAQHTFTQRQYAYRKNGHTSGVYTPGFLANSKEWRGWYKADAQAIQNNYGGNLMLRVKDQKIKVTYSKEGSYEIHLALLGFGLETKVPRGENKGKLLKHNFVVLTMQSYFYNHSDSNIPLLTSPINAKKYALVAWITPRNSLQVLQSVGGWLE